MKNELHVFFHFNLKGNVMHSVFISDCMCLINFFVSKPSLCLKIHVATIEYLLTPVQNVPCNIANWLVTNIRKYIKAIITVFQLGNALLFSRTKYESLNFKGMMLFD